MFFFTSPRLADGLHLLTPGVMAMHRQRPASVDLLRRRRGAAQRQAQALAARGQPQGVAGRQQRGEVGAAGTRGTGGTGDTGDTGGWGLHHGKNGMK